MKHFISIALLLVTSLSFAQESSSGDYLVRCKFAANVTIEDYAKSMNDEAVYMFNLHQKGVVKNVFIKNTVKLKDSSLVYTLHVKSRKAAETVVNNSPTAQQLGKNRASCSIKALGELWFSKFEGEK